MEIDILKERIIDSLKAGSKSFDDLRELCEGDMISLRTVINELSSDLAVITDRKGLLALPENCGLIRGTLQVKRGGFGFVLCDDGDIFIEKSNLRGALNQETVLVKITKNFPGQSREGRVIRIADKPYFAVGTVRTGRKGATLVPDDPALSNIILGRKGRGTSRPGDKVVAQITRRSIGKLPCEGKVTEILGNEDEKGIDILSIARSFGLKENFPKDVEAYAASLSPEVPEEALKGRKLLFDKLIITIDGDDSKDFDDAVSIEKLGDGSYILGVHIADVSHYVKEDSAIDKEALKRATSVYMVDRVVPMLPKELSNGICSLNEGVIRLTLSCFMKIDHSGNVVWHKIEKTAIRSRHRMTYNNVNKILSGDSAKKCEYPDLIKPLGIMNELAHILREKRFTGGSIDFDIPEAKIILDENNYPTDIKLRERGEGEKLIEEFMLVCNETVAMEYEQKGLPFVYRIHENPDCDRMNELSDFLSTFGYKLPKNQKIPSYIISEILKMTEDSEDAAIISRVILRSLKKARYSTVNEGHFGLASECYCHFTSPIRRYPDLQIHRIISEDLEGNLSKKRINRLKSILPSVAAKSSERERNAIEAERRVDAVKMAEYMQNYVGVEFSAVISGATSSCLFAELKNTVEGVIPLSSLKDDYYEFIPERYLVKGMRTDKKIRLGDAVTVRVITADKDNARVQFELLKTKKRTKKQVTKRA